MCSKIQAIILLMSAVLASCRPDGGGPDLPPSGLSYGGIPYGSMSGNLAEYFSRQAPSVGRSASYAYNHPTVVAHAPSYAPIEQWL